MEKNNCATQFECFKKNLNRKFLRTLTSEELERRKNIQVDFNGDTRLEEDFKIFCYWDEYFFNSAKKYFVKHNLSQEERYAFIKQAYFEGFSSCFESKDDKLVEPKLYQYFDIEHLKKAISNYDHYVLAELFQNNPNKEFFCFLHKEYYYWENEGHTPRSMIELMQTPQDIDYRKEVPQNDFIDIFNTIYDDACVYEKWPSKINGLATLPNKTHLNQDNLISLAKSLYGWGPGWGERTYKGVRNYYKAITNRINNGELTLYDYQSDTLKNIKLQIGESIGTNIVQAPYTNYVLQQFSTQEIAEKKIESILKELILFNPEKQQKVYIRK